MAIDRDDELKGDQSDKPWWNQMMREMALTGLATVFMTEESIRKYVKDRKLPKEAIALLLENLSRKKGDFYGMIGKEFGSMLSKVDFAKEMGKFLEKHRVQIEAKVSFEPKTKDNEEGNA